MVNIDMNAELYQRFFVQNPVGDILFTVGSEGTNTVDIDIQVADLGSEALARQVMLKCYLTSDDAGTTVHAPSGSTTITPSTGVGTILDENSGKTFFNVLTDDHGVANIRLTNSDTGDYYLCVVLPDGRIVIAEDPAVFTA
jgi:hypothetical protein